MNSASLRRLRVARLSTFVYFTLNGFVMGLWVVHIPAIEHRAGISHATLGWLLLVLGGGALVGMRICGQLTDRLGARSVVPAGAALCSAALTLPGVADRAWLLGVALFVLGLGNGCLDVSMNTHASQVERRYDRPVMSAFHAMFSIGGVLAALLGARTTSWGWSPPATLTGTAIFGVLVATLAAPGLLGREHATDSPASEQNGQDTADNKPDKPRTPARVWTLGLLALTLMLSEGVANDWSVVHLQDILDAPAATAALAYGAFATAMTVGRFSTDWIVARAGPVFVVRYGAALAALGLTSAALSPWIPLALVGWTVFGIGLSGCIPQFFTAAANVDPTSAGTNVSRVAGLGYLGALAGPALIGPLTHVVPLNIAFFLPVAFCLLAMCSAVILRPPRTNSSSVTRPVKTTEKLESREDPENLKESEPLPDR